MGFAEKVIAQAKAQARRLILPEGEDPRMLSAARQLVDQGIAKEVLLLGSRPQVEAAAQAAGVSLLGLKHCQTDELAGRDELARELHRLRAHRGMSEAEAWQLSGDPLHAAALMLRLGKTDAVVAGAVHTTAAMLRVSFTVLQTRPGIKTASSFFLMETPRLELGEGGQLLFADCAILPQPSAEQLAEIAILTAESCRRYLQVEPRVAMLSFSSKGSASHELVDRVVSACALVKKMKPEICVDGELQLDAAIIPAVAEKKAPGSPVAGRANVLIFPDLQSGNIGYKLVERFAQAHAYGPFLQGIAYPISDLSRGCCARDIVITSAMTLLQH